MLLGKVMRLVGVKHHRFPNPWLSEKIWKQKTRKMLVSSFVVGFRIQEPARNLTPTEALRFVSISKPKNKSTLFRLRV